MQLYRWSFCLFVEIEPLTEVSVGAISFEKKSPSPNDLLGNTVSVITKIKESTLTEWPFHSD